MSFDCDLGMYCVEFMQIAMFRKDNYDEKILVAILLRTLMVSALSVHATSRSDTRQEARNVRQDTRTSGRQTKQDCFVDYNQKKADCSQDKREN